MQDFRPFDNQADMGDIAADDEGCDVGGLRRDYAAAERLDDLAIPSIALVQVDTARDVREVFRNGQSGGPICRADYATAVGSAHRLGWSSEMVIQTKLSTDPCLCFGNRGGALLGNPVNRYGAECLGFGHAGN